MLQFDVVTIFPAMFDAVAEAGVIGRAREKGIYQLVAWNPRDFAQNAYRTVDDRPYGGGPGMVMMAEPVGRALAAARQRQKSAGVQKPRVVHLTPQGRLLNHQLVMELAGQQGLVLQGVTKAWMSVQLHAARTGSTTKYRSAITCCRAASWRRWC